MQPDALPKAHEHPMREAYRFADRVGQGRVISPLVVPLQQPDRFRCRAGIRKPSPAGQHFPVGHSHELSQHFRQTRGRTLILHPLQEPIQEPAQGAIDLVNKALGAQLVQQPINLLLREPALILRKLHTP